MTSSARPKVVTRTERVIDHLRELILTGAYEAGAHLQEVRLATQLNVSRTPIRDALRILANENLLTYSPHSGYFVRHYPLRQILDAYDVRGTLEGMACRLAAERGVPRDVGDQLLRTLNAAETVLSGQAWGDEEEAAWKRLNLDFHNLISSNADNHHLPALTEQMRKQPRLSDLRLHPDAKFYMEVYNREHRRVSHQEHHAILDAVLGRQGGRAEHLMREHVHRNRRALEARLAQTALVTALGAND